jgi:hypothetical protein
MLGSSWLYRDKRWIRSWEFVSHSHHEMRRGTGAVSGPVVKCPYWSSQKEGWDRREKGKNDPFRGKPVGKFSLAHFGGEGVDGRTVLRWG